MNLLKKIIYKPLESAYFTLLRPLLLKMINDLQQDPATPNLCKQKNNNKKITKKTLGLVYRKMIRPIIVKITLDIKSIKPPSLQALSAPAVPVYQKPTFSPSLLSQLDEIDGIKLAYIKELHLNNGPKKPFENFLEKHGLVQYKSPFATRSLIDLKIPQISFILKHTRNETGKKVLIAGQVVEQLSQLLSMTTNYEIDIVNNNDKTANKLLNETLRPNHYDHVIYNFSLDHNPDDIIDTLAICKEMLNTKFIFTMPFFTTEHLESIINQTTLLISTIEQQFKCQELITAAYNSQLAEWKISSLEAVMIDQHVDMVMVMFAGQSK